MVRKCPKCGQDMKDIGRDRTVRGGVWRVLVCPRCQHMYDEFRPRREQRDEAIHDTNPRGENRG